VPANASSNRVLTMVALGVATGMLCCAEKPLRSAGPDQMDDGKASS